MNLKINVIDEQGLGKYLKGLPRSAKKHTELGLYKASNKLRNNVIKAMKNTPRESGTSYVRTKDGKTHSPSRAGNPPAVDSGNYIRGIQLSKISGGGMVFVTGVPYASYLEDGTGNMEARPVWEKQIQNLNVMSIIEREIQKGL